MDNQNGNIYEKLPVIYEYIMRKVSYKVWAEYLTTILKDYISYDTAVLELAAGNCRLANKLVDYFPNLFASDLSYNMLKQDNKSIIPKVCCDMQSIPFKTRFGLIYSTFDSVNYLCSKKSLLKMFKEVKSCLIENGVFAFDVSLERNSFIHTKIPRREGNYNGIYFNQTSSYDKKKRIHTNSFEITLNSGEVFKEVHKQKIYPFETYFELLEKAGMYVVKCYNSFTLRDGNPDSARVQFITKRIKRHA